MGGSKKPTAASKDKSSGSRDTKKKKDKGEGGGSGPKKAEITVLVNSKQAMRIIENSKVITVQDLARQMGVKISAANAFLKESASNGIIKRVGGYSGHYLYQAATKEEPSSQVSKSDSQSELAGEKEGDGGGALVAPAATAAESS